MSDERIASYAKPEKLVTTAWVAENLGREDVRIVESDEDVLLYDMGHVPGAVKIDWHTDLQHPLQRDYLHADAFAALMSQKGISRDTTVVFYGDKNNWWACYALWVFELFGHPSCRVMDGGRAKWEVEGREMSTAVPDYPAGDYPVPDRSDARIRAFRDDVLEHVGGGKPLIDVRSPEEYRGERLHMPDYPNEGALRGGHIPGAANIPWGRAVQENGTFKPVEELRALYEGEAGLSSDDEVVAYCRIGERSSHTWFVLHYLLGYPHVRNYDGSWTEWGNLVQAPIEK
ncbi:MAG: sulfurtransferase [Gemmatimonadales bacterium]|jgi:thiosulfate/3-mercaptopyruvate sulfurtransferase